MTVRAADDAETIGRRLAELREERLAWARCTCADVVDAHGHAAKSLSPDCPIHRPANPAAPQMLVSDILRIVGGPGRFVVVTERVAEWPA